MAPPLVAHACPRCSAAVRPGAPWCTQCYADLRRAQGPVDADDSPVVPDRGVRAQTVEVTEPSADEPCWPCAACGTATPLGTDACTGCGEGFLAAVRAEQAPSLVLPVVGDLVRLPRGQRIGVALAVVLAVLLLSVLLVLLLGQT